MSNQRSSKSSTAGTMEETLRSIRLAHNGLLALCLAVIGFAISPSDAQRYQELLVSIGQFEGNLSSYDPNLLESERKRVIEEATSATTSFQHALHSLGISLETEVEPTSLIPLRYPIDILETTERTPVPLALSPAGPVASYRRHRTISEILELLRNPPQVSIFRPDDLEGEVRNWLRPVRNTQAKLVSIRVGGIQLAGRPQIEAYLEVRLDKATFDSRRAQILSEASQLLISPRIVELSESVLISFDVRIHGENNVKVENAEFVSWLSTQSESPPSNGAGSPLEILVPPGILASLEELGGLTIDEALSEITTRKADAEAQEKVSLFGVEILADTAAVVAPLSMSLMLLYLTAQLMNVHPRNTDQLELLDQFPWLGLFSDRLSRTLTLLSIALLPFVASVWLQVRLWPPGSMFYWIGSTLTASVAVSGIFAIRKITRVRALASSR